MCEVDEVTPESIARSAVVAELNWKEAKPDQVK